jgi:hypothetical protein
VHDKKAEWIWGVLAGLEAAGLVVLADKGSDYAKIPYRGRNKPESQKAANRAHAKLRAPGERERAVEELAHPAQAPLLPLARRATRQSHPRAGDPRRIRRMEKAQWIAVERGLHGELIGITAGWIYRQDLLLRSDCQGNSSTR